jgi:hypothetical protein
VNPDTPLGTGGKPSFSEHMHDTTARARGQVPDFIILGAQKAGTTSLHENLTKHPRIAEATRKEVHFFDNQYFKGADWYRQQFPKPRLSKPWVITGEATPYYLFHPFVPDRIAETSPHVKFVVLLRDPVTRAYSHWQLIHEREREDLSFEDAIAAEPERLAGEAAKLEDPTYRSAAHQHQSYVSRGIYADQIAAFTKRFGWDRFLILSAEEFFSDPRTATKQVFEFLGLRPKTLRGYAHRMVGRYQEGMKAQTRDQLRELFRPHNQRLFEMLGRDFGWND